MLTLVSPSPGATHEIAAAIAGLARSGDLIVLAGEMGSGKTAFAQGVGAALGVDEPITSPTFTLVHSYALPSTWGKTALHHADLYRLDRLSELADLALGELLESDGIVLVEWGDVVGSSLGDHLEVRLTADDPQAADHRQIDIRAIGRSWASRWRALETAVADWRSGGGRVAAC